MAEDLKLMESRLEALEKKYQDLLGKQDKDEGGNKGKNDNGVKKDDKEKERSEEKTSSPEAELDENIPLTPKLNRLSWAQWRKIRLAEEEWENKTEEQKTREIKRRKKKPERFVIDVVADTGDLRLPFTYTERYASTKRYKFPCRIRINSQHILDALIEISNVALPRKCQILHPYKIIIDNLDGIKDYMKTLENEVKKAEIGAKSDLPANSKDEDDQKKEKGPLPTIEENTQKSPTEKNAKIPSKSKPLKAKVEEDLELAKEKLAHYRCLIELLETDLASEVQVANSIKDGSSEKIMFCHLWHLFPPGETIYYQNANRDEPPQATQVLKVSGGRAKLPNSARDLPWWYGTSPELEASFQKVSPFTIDAFHLDFDGKKFRLVQVKYDIPRYTGEVPITSLSVFPLRFLSEPIRDETMTLLLNRGLNFQSLVAVDVAHREYCGMTLDDEREDIDGRVIIDFKQAPVVRPSSNKFSNKNEKESDNKGRIFGLRPFSQTKEYEVEEFLGSNDVLDSTLYNDHKYDSDKTDMLFSTNKVLLTPSQEMSADDLTDDELRLLPGEVYAYVLRSRKYCKCDINFIKEINLNREAFDDLVLPKKHRTIIKSLVDRHSLGSRPVEQPAEQDRLILKRTDSRSTENKNNHQDTLSIVKGKGRGLIILLHGVPGVGKTSTAETIAEATKRPLLPVTCGDIGETAADVERNLEQIFTNSHRWGCVLLLDEAEVFLTKRNLQDLTRNAMVSVFLRALEFYSGILFLTTNRVGTIDEAFKSRIHISLYYPPLDWKTSKLIWQVNMRRSQAKVEIDKDDIIRFAKKHYIRSDENSRWNGRQIYNAFKTAIALAEFEKQTADGDKDQKPVLTASHLRQVAQVAKDFDEYLLQTQGGETTAVMNQNYRVRADHFGQDDAPQKLKRRSTKSRILDLDELPTTSEADSDDSDDGFESPEEETDSEEVKKSKKKRESSSKKNDDKKKGRKSKKSSKKPVDDSSDSSL
ncbi:P-loop containing nucleoside triphosphate hydrolase protein [Xylariaceae sp. FL0662B]|nr:P-loop containing nucleoside triphosphate hydrolase protein [Xylariaceae sp. FL0662B]